MLGRLSEILSTPGNNGLLMVWSGFKILGIISAKICSIGDSNNCELDGKDSLGKEDFDDSVCTHLATWQQSTELTYNLVYPNWQTNSLKLTHLAGLHSHKYELQQSFSGIIWRSW